MVTLGGDAKVAVASIVDADWMSFQSGCVGVPTRGSPLMAEDDGMLRMMRYDGSCMKRMSMSLLSVSRRVVVKLVFLFKLMQ